MSVPKNGDVSLQIFVHLAYGYGGKAWRQRWENDQIRGINEDNAYGYLRARQMGCRVTVSEDDMEGRLQVFVRMAVRFLLGFDFIHAYRNRRGILEADVVWTHTESQSLSISLLLLIFKRPSKPRLIAQSVWLMDSWNSYSKLRRVLYRKLIQRWDIMTFHSEEAVQLAKILFSEKRVEFVRFGINADQQFRSHRRSVAKPLHILSLGNDRHRDWKTLVAAFANAPEYLVRIATRMDLSNLLAGVENIEIVQPKNNRELMALYDWSDVVAVCLSENLHASGLTVVQEAILQSIPVVCTDAGGLRSYFAADEISYAPIARPLALRQAVDHLASDAGMRRNMSTKALMRMRQGGISSHDFVVRHVELSKELLYGSPVAQDSE